ncbi:hypothetical protein BB341_20505 [Streptomyces clavuligerus]|nr:hypothetical protein BB341_20505 [Streptomyces clavuligerus]AXU15045.1 hypothetical protein D1794_21340 [Streptomyces clavuligerus]QCS07819.1 hypothetical protein CRV15_20705 [Streptomyces clavuligerus]
MAVDGSLARSGGHPLRQPFTPTATHPDGRSVRRRTNGTGRPTADDAGRTEPNGRRTRPNGGREDPGAAVRTVDRAEAARDRPGRPF